MHLGGCAPSRSSCLATWPLALAHYPVLLTLNCLRKRSLALLCGEVLSEESQVIANTEALHYADPGDSDVHLFALLGKTPRSKRVNARGPYVFVILSMTVERFFIVREEFGFRASAGILTGTPQCPLCRIIWWHGIPLVSPWGCFFG